MNCGDNFLLSVQSHIAIHSPTHGFSNRREVKVLDQVVVGLTYPLAPFRGCLDDSSSQSTRVKDYRTLD